MAVQRTWGAQLIARLFGIPQDESLDAFLETAKRSDPHALHSVMSEVGRSSLPEGLDKVSVPVLAVVGEKDTLLAKRGAKYIQQAIPNARGFIVRGVGHQWNAQKCELFSRTVRLWIDSETVDECFVPIRESQTE